MTRRQHSRPSRATTRPAWTTSGARRVVHHGGGDGVGGDDDEVGGRADGQARAVVVEHGRRRPRPAVDDGPSAAGRDVDAALDQLVVAVAGAERQLPGSLEDVAVAVWRPVVTDAVLAEPDAHTGRPQRAPAATARGCRGRPS